MFCIVYENDSPDKHFRAIPLISCVLLQREGNDNGKSGQREWQGSAESPSSPEGRIHQISHLKLVTIALSFENVTLSSLLCKPTSYIATSNKNPFIKPVVNKLLYHIFPLLNVTRKSNGKLLSWFSFLILWTQSSQLTVHCCKGRCETRVCWLTLNLEPLAIPGAGTPRSFGDL